MNIYLVDIDTFKKKKPYLSDIIKVDKYKVLKYSDLIPEKDGYTVEDYFIYSIMLEYEIKKLQKKYKDVVYVVKDINRVLIYNLIKFFDCKNVFIENFYLIDSDSDVNDNSSKDYRKMYKFFSKVL